VGFFQFTENDFVAVPIAEGLLLLLAVSVPIPIAIGHGAVAVEDFPGHHMLQHELLQPRLLNVPDIDFGHNQCVGQVCRNAKETGNQLPRELLT